MKLTLLHIAGIIAIVQAILMAGIFLNTKKYSNPSNKLLAGLLLCFAIILTYSITQSRGLAEKFIPYHKIIFIAGQFGFLIGPLFFFYFKSMLEQNFHFQKKHLLHLVPFLIVNTYLTIKFVLIHDFIIWPFIFRFIFAFLILIQGIIYIIASLGLLKYHGQTLKSYLNSTADSQITWLKFIIGGYIVFWLVQLQSFILVGLAHAPWWCSATASLYFLFLVIFFNTIVIAAINNPKLFLKMKKYEKSVLNDSHKKRYREKLVNHMISQKPYLNPLCSLTGLAQELPISVNYLSQIINETFQQNFYDFINSYRINESKMLLENNFINKKTILEIAYEVGFNSKTTFNNAFKKFTGITPREYKKTLRSSTQS